MFKEPLSTVKSLRFIPIFSSMSFRVLVLTFKYLISLELIFVRGMSYEWNTILSHIYMPFAKKTVLSSLNCLGILVKNPIINMSSFRNSQFYSISLYASSTLFFLAFIKHTIFIHIGT